MENRVHTFIVDIDWKLINLISEIDRFDAAWSSIERKEGQSLKELKSVATVRSVGASTRIEGSSMSDEEVEVLLHHLKTSKLEDRDSQEVAGYFEVLDRITGSYGDIAISENSIRHLHNILLKHSKKDAWHKGNYKQHPNAVEATFPDGSKQMIFKTTAPGYETEDAMKALINWYKTDRTTPSLIKCAVFAYEFVTIHPFQDGNGRLSRLLTTLVLLKNNYKWIEYVSLEHEIENRKPEYYRVLRNCQSQRPEENISEWLFFFLDALKNIQQHLLKKLEEAGLASQLSPKEKAILNYIGNHPGATSGEIAKKLDMALPSVKRLLSQLTGQNLIEKYGSGPGTNYSLK